jgi:hypothetical protein
VRLTEFCNLSDYDGFCYTHTQYHHPDPPGVERVSMADLCTEPLEGKECPTCGTFIGPCVGGKQHSEVVTPGDDYDPRVLGETPNAHQYGYCIDCRCPMRWDVDEQRWVNWTAAERGSWKAERDQEILDRQRAIEASLA